MHAKKEFSLLLDCTFGSQPHPFHISQELKVTNSSRS